MATRTDPEDGKKAFRYLEAFDLNELAFVQSRLKGSLEIWAGDWFNFEQKPRFSDLRPYWVAGHSSDVSDVSLACETDYGGALWVDDFGKFKLTLKEFLFGIPNNRKSVTARIDEIVEACISDFKAILAKQFGVQSFIDSQSISDEGLGFWSGLYVCRVDFNRQSLSIILDSNCIKHVLVDGDGLTRQRSSIEQRSRSVSVLEAIRSSKVKLAVTMQGCEVDLGQLQALRVGDIVTLQHRLDQALSVVDSKQELVCEAFIGTSRGLKAVELSAVVSNQ